MYWYFQALQKYATFKGRARRKEFWMFYLINYVFMAITAIFDSIFNLTIGDYHYGFGLISTLYILAIFIPTFSVTIRRLQDIGKSAITLLLIFIPVVGFIWLLVLYAKDSEPGVNIYGTNPKESYTLN